MPHENAFEGRLEDVEVRAKLGARNPPYWQVTEYGRAIGFQKYDHAGEFWVARARLKDGYYKRRRLAIVQQDEGGIGATFGEALDLAEAWYKTISHLTADAIPIGSREHLSVCPIGTEFTIAHALTDFLEWKRLAAAHSHFLTLVCIVNYHIVPRLASVLAADLNGEIVRNFVRDVLETPPKRGNMHGQLPPPKRPINQMTEEEMRGRKVPSIPSSASSGLRFSWLGKMAKSTPKEPGAASGDCRSSINLGRCIFLARSAGVSWKTVLQTYAI